MSRRAAAPPALKALDPGGRVIYITSLSKMLMPGLRVGFLVADGPVYGALVARPRGGLFAWLRFPEGCHCRKLVPLAEARGVRVAPGRLFFQDPDEGERHVCVNFACQPPEEVAQGIERLGQALAQITRR